MTNPGENLYKKIDTFVFFDLETTDLIKGSKMPKITELAMVAASRDSLKSDRRNKLAVPRILHKLTIPVCPTQPIHPQASFASNLWNDTLELYQPFNESTYDIIMQFLKRLPGLVCFIAHNGNNFDYPVFLSEIQQINKTLPDQILCVDSLKAFQEFFSDIPDDPVPPPIPAGHDEVDEEELRRRQKNLNNSLDDNWDDALCDVMDDFDQFSAGGNEFKNRRVTCENGFDGKDVLDAITNKSQSGCNKNALANNTQKTMQEINETTPENQIMRSTCPIRIPKTNLNNARRTLNFHNSKPKNFKLSTIYLHMIGIEAENQHCAEGDCITMLRCICQMGPHFAEWADCNAISMNLLKK